MRTAIFTLLALVGFAANSVLNRWALVGETIDPGSFATIRLGAGALALVALVRLRRSGPPAGSWRGGIALVAYAVPFSLSYLALTAGTGALILFGAVQVTMIGTGLLEGERPGLLAWLGLSLAGGGLVYLVSPGLAAPPVLAALSMVAAGVAWGIYSLLGRGGDRPLAVTAGNFGRAFVLSLGILGLLVLVGAPASLTKAGVILAVVSGAVTSGLAYALWYAALKDLSATRAATVQLSVPVLAAFGGVLVLAEPITFRLTIASVLILGGVAMALRDRTPPTAEDGPEPA